MTEVLDSEIVDQLRDLGGEELLRELFQTFLDLAPERLSAVGRGVRDRDFEAIARAAHSLRSSGSSIGARSLADQAARVEDAANRGAAEEVGETYRDLERLGARVVGELRLRIGPRG